MLFKIFNGLGVLMLLWMTWALFVGWSSLPHYVAHNVPRSVRDNPGSYRAIYTSHTHYVGGK